MKKVVFTAVAVVGLLVAGCLPPDEGGGGGGGTTTFTSGFVFVRADHNVYAADSSDYQSVIQLTTDANDHFPSLSADGKRVVYVHTDGATTTLKSVAPAASSTASTVLSSDSTKTNFRYPVFSPDGTKIAFTYDSGATSFIGLVNADGSGFTALSPNTLSFGAPCFMNATTIIAPAGNSSGQYTQIQTVTTSGTTATVVSALGNEATSIANRVVVSKDGATAAFDARISTGSTRIFVMPISGGTGGTITQLTDHPGEPGANDTFPTFVSNDQVAFGSDSGQADQVYVASTTSATKTAGTLTVPSALEPWFGP